MTVDAAVATPAPGGRQHRDRCGSDPGGLRRYGFHGLSRILALVWPVGCDLPAASCCCIRPAGPAARLVPARLVGIHHLPLLAGVRTTRGDRNLLVLLTVTFWLLTIATFAGNAFLAQLSGNVLMVDAAVALFLSAASIVNGAWGVAPSSPRRRQGQWNPHDVDRSCASATVAPPGGSRSR